MMFTLCRIDVRHLLITFLFVTLVGCGGSPGPAGVQGPKGDPGPLGLNGPQGPAGIAIGSGITCNHADSGSGTTLVYNYESVLYASNDRFVKCAISNTLGTYSNTVIYRASQVGAVTGSCIVNFDLDGASFGFWAFSSQAGTTRTVYNDALNGSDQYTYTFTSSDCTVF